MDFGKVRPSDLRRIDFHLPPLPASALKPQIQSSPPRFWIGAPIWSQKQWLGRVYPLGTKPQDFLGLYSQQFNSIELNSTHYHLPSIEGVEALCSQVPAHFKFCPKWPQEISHHRQLGQLAPCDVLTQAFCEAIFRMGPHLGTTFLQLPPGFSAAQLPALAHFLKTLPAGFPICVEFRHPTWFHHGTLLSSALQILERAGAGTVVTDTAGRRDVVHLNTTHSQVVVRFVGNQLDPTDHERIDQWIEPLQHWVSHGIQDVFFFVHQPDNDVAPELISYLIDRLKLARVPGSDFVQNWERKDGGMQLGLF